MENNTSLDFDAPQHYFDLRNHCDDSGLDAYFDVDHEASEEMASALSTSSVQECSPGSHTLKDVTNVSQSTVVSGGSSTSVSRPVPKLSSLSGPSRRRSRSHDPSLSRPRPLVLPETPNVLRRGVAQRLAARAAAHKAAQQHQQNQLAGQYSRQLLAHRRSAAVARATSTQPLAAPSDQPFKSMAQQLLEFERKTPPRFHSGAPGNQGPPPCRESRPANTTARSPVLSTRLRSRSVDCLSHDQLQLLEFQRCQQLAVRAQPLNTAILQHVVGVPARERRPSTQQRPFNLTATTQAPAEVAEPGRSERKRSISGSVVNRSQFVKKRRRSVSCDRCPSDSSGVRQSRSVANKQNTRILPFSFDSRDKHRALLKQQRIDQLLEQERRQREFKAQLLPCSEQRVLPERVCRSTTAMREFNLPGLRIHQNNVLKLREKLESEQRQRCEARQFHARPCTVTQQNAFQPARSRRPALRPDSVILHSDVRAEQRRQFEQGQVERQSAADALRHQEELEKQKQLELETARLRQETVHKPLPLPAAAPFFPQKSNMPLTNPQTPMITKKRAALQ